jgi:hypothetical protein
MRERVGAGWRMMFVAKLAPPLCLNDMLLPPPANIGTNRELVAAEGLENSRACRSVVEPGQQAGGAVRDMECTMSSAQKTTDHDEIRKWIEARKGRPSIVGATGDNGREGGLLRIDFGEKDDELEEVEWDKFFEIFDKNGLVFLHQDKTSDGKTSRFNKFVSADGD